MDKGLVNALRESRVVYLSLDSEKRLQLTVDVPGSGLAPRTMLEFVTVWAMQGKGQYSRALQSYQEELRLGLEKIPEDFLPGKRKVPSDRRTGADVKALHNEAAKRHNEGTPAQVAESVVEADRVARNLPREEKDRLQRSIAQNLRNKYRAKTRPK